MDWDSESELIYSDWGGQRAIALAVVLVVFTALTAFSVTDMVKPKHRGDITIAEFADNYNFYYAMFDGDTVSRSERLQPDGTWYTESDNHVTIYINGQPEKADQTFFYKTENGILRGIHYENSWTDIFILNPVPNRCKIAAITVLMSQEKSGYKELLEFSKKLDALDFTESGFLRYEGMELSWNVESENCIVVDWDGKSMLRDDENSPSRVSTVFNIVINP